MDEKQQYLNDSVVAEEVQKARQVLKEVDEKFSVAGPL